MKSSETNISFSRIQQLAIPAIIAGVAEPVLSITDTAIVGNIPEYGTESLAAVGIVGSFLSALIWILAQTRSAIAAIVAQNLGAGKIEQLKRFPAQAIFYNIALSIIVLFSTYFFVEEIFILFNAKGMILDLSVDYYNIRVWGFPLTLFTFAVFGLFRGLQNTFWPMIIAAIGAGINVILDFALVYGIPDVIEPMNVIGAAWASLVSQAIMALLSLILLLKKTDVSLRLKRDIHPEIHRLIVMSANLILRSIALNAALILATREATDLGKEYIAAHVIAYNVWIFAAFFIDGYGAAGNILGGKLLGEQNFKALWTVTKRVNAYNLVVALLLMLLGVAGYDYIGGFFNDDAKVISLFKDIFYMVIISLPFCSLAFTLDAIFKGLGEMGYLRNVLLGATLFGFVPVLYVTKYLDWELYGIWLAMIVWVAYRALALIIKYWRKYYVLVK
ncbi:MATE family efflux transporter [Aureisphaera galaxeae]|uniref:MATE family efflux transporter n=1 Tax=Aureisphaera galaxeae TaxID=1538023 RepID=UPI00235088BD|nr:MATE family efflux transporter [Aureisphaera galaxeae]MDC8005188.1 MATE family efflux transporter [Aureisphaera galaxeae]